MKTLKIYLFVLITFAFINLNGQDTDQRPAKERMSQVTMTGTVKEVVKETRSITIMGQNGELTTLVADESVERFDEISVGDIISADFFAYMMAEFREPTPEEIADPIVIVAVEDRAPEGMDPAGGIGAVIRAVVTIEILNRPFMLATVRGPLGNYLTIEMEDEELIQELNIGQVLILTYAEVIVMSLTKVNAEE